MITFTRADLRGEKLEKICKKANTTTETYTEIKTKTRVKITCCYGCTDSRNDEPIERCKNCKAFIRNVLDW